MGTTWSLRLDNPNMLALDSIRASVEAAFDQVIAQMSTWEPHSDICRFNQAPAGSVHRLAPEFLKVLGCALHWAESSRGAIDPTIGPLVGLWGFGANAVAAKRPTPEALAAAREQVGWRRLRLDHDTACVEQPGSVELDLSGIAKGFAVDHACAALHDLGLHNFLMEVGGELRASGMRPDGQPWRVRVEAAQDEHLQLALRDQSIATSGDRWHMHSEGGMRWSHTIDPRTGLPVAHRLAAVSVLHPECMHADALATLLTVLGPEQGMDFARQHDVAALFVVRDLGKSLSRIASPRWASDAGLA